MKLILILAHVTVCVALIVVVLLQRGKGASMGAAFGGSSQTLFGTGGATTFMQKLTTAAAIIFMLTSLALSIFLSRGGTSSVMEDVTTEIPAAQSVPASAPPVEPQK
jgi:preprotein translocase subunit SecG